MGEGEHSGFDWEELKERYGAEEVDALAAAFENYDVCPRSEEQLGEVWSPFHASIGLNESWRSYYKYKHDYYYYCYCYCKYFFHV